VNTNTQRHDLADRSGLTYVTIGRILRGERDLTMPYLVSLAGAFGWTAGELLLRAEARLREHGHDVPGNPGSHPDDEAVIDASTKLTKRQREQAKQALKDDVPGTTRMPSMRTAGESVGSSVRRPRTAG
jgi:transcriptional regulator with XRE-family HTH domain